MATDQYLQIDGLKGESTDSDHKDWIEILSYSLAASAPAPGTAEAAATNQTKPSGPGDIVITKQMDSSSPKLLALCSSGKHIGKATIESTANGQPETIEMSDVVVSNVSPQDGAADRAAGSKSATDVPTESITLDYGKIQWTYTQQK
jgi:type VI secretion system secreted protein Hcp